MTQDWVAQIQSHPSASLEEIEGEPEWKAGRHHHIGYKNRDKRRPGYTQEELLRYDQHDKKVIKDAKEQLENIRQKAKKGDLINFRDVVTGVKDFRHQDASLRPLGWRYVIETSEESIKYHQNWPANQKRQKDEQASENKSEDKQKDDDGSQDTEDESDEQELSTEEKIKHRFTQLIREEADYMKNLRNNDGMGKSGQDAGLENITIDEQDQLTPDNWFPRSPALTRTTGAHPLNAEAPLAMLLNDSLITPSNLHYVRNHGSVPRLHWELHKLEVTHQDSQVILSMDDIVNNYSPLNIPIFISCDGNRRKELSMTRTAIGAPFGSGAVGCSYWKGVLVRDILRSVGVAHPWDPNKNDKDSTIHWVNFEGADELPEGNYTTCVRLDHVMDPTNDVMLAYEMNDDPIPPDHGYPIRLVVPGYVGGRSVKWVRRIWTSCHEDNSYYHIWDNRCMPSFITSLHDDMADAMFHHPGTALTEQMLNSVIVHPGHGERISLSTDPSKTYRIDGFAYNGGGRMIQRVEISLDDGSSWLYCFKTFPQSPLRHDYKSWTWLRWHIDVPMLNLFRAKSIVVRCFDICNTQPREHVWNILGMMNNSWHTVKLKIQKAEETQQAEFFCQHPVEPGPGQGGWMNHSVENRLEMERQNVSSSGAQEQYTREEIEKHDNASDCWIVVDGKVYDATSVLSWHPGGSSVVLGHAGQAHYQTTAEYNSIHDSYAREKLQECMIGVVTEKTAKFIEQTAKDEEKEKAAANQTPDNQALQEHRWTSVKLVSRREASHDTRSYKFELPEGERFLGLGNGQHIEVAFHMLDRMLIRPYTPTCPLLPPIEGTKRQENDVDGKSEWRDGQGTFDLTVKTYFPDDDQPGGAMSNILDTIPLGEDVDIRGPKGAIIYQGQGRFTIDGQDRTFRRVSMVLGGTGITPGYSVLGRIALSEDDSTEVNVLDANNTIDDILLKDEFESFAKMSNGRVKVKNVIADPPKDWSGLRGFITKDMMKEHLFPPGDDSVVLVCGPPVMIRKAVMPGLKELGYEPDENIFGF